MAIRITSRSFRHNEKLPKKHSFKGGNISPNIEWMSVPRNCRSLVLIAFDQRRGEEDSALWIVYNIPPEMLELDEGLPTLSKLSNGVRQGISDAHRTGYTGPRYGAGRHKFTFRLFALDQILDLPVEYATRANVEKMMRNHVVDMGEISANYFEEQA